MRSVCCVIFIIFSANYCFSQSFYNKEKDIEMVKELLNKIDANILDMSVYDNNVVHMAQGSRPVTSKNELANVLNKESAYGKSTMKHEIIDIHSFTTTVVTRGRAKGSFISSTGGNPLPFETNNMIVFNRQIDGALKIGYVIFNRIDLTVKPENPFHKFFGEWTLKNDNWSQNWGGEDENIKIPNHHTLCKPLNTDNSLLAVIDGVPPFGHIFWSYNPLKKEVDHLSSFGSSRAGVGKGNVNENGDVSLKISFADEAEGTYRLYTYIWVNDDEYILKSIQYNAKNQPTGLFYSGTFVRIHHKY